MNDEKRTAMEGKMRQFFVARVLGLLVALALAPVAFGAWPSDRVIVTDMLDDDIRALLHILSDPAHARTVRAIVVSTGNTQLKAEVARRIVTSFGLRIPVYVGTSTDLSDNPVTRFAANFEAEGRHVLDEPIRWHLRERFGESGNAADQLAGLFRGHSPSRPLDVLLLTAPTDLVAAIDRDPHAAMGALGDLFTMGLYKETASGSLVAPYNTMAGPDSVRRLFELHNGGMFARIYHAPSDTVQSRSGLPGGYFPEDAEGLAYRHALTHVMESNPGLRPILRAAQEYGLSWRTSAIQQFGVGFDSASRWVPASFADPATAAGFYLADTVPSVMSRMPAEELARLTLRDSYVRFPSGLTPEASRRPFDIPRAPESDRTGVRPLVDLVSFDGPVALQRHLEQLTRVGPSMTPAARSSVFVDGLAAPAHVGMDSLPEPAGRRALVMTFKNSPDDWFALLRTLSTERGRRALEAGGIITEGFQTREMATAVEAVLGDLGFSQIPIAAGYQYAAGEVDAVPNFAGELALQREHQALRAFDSLVAARGNRPSRVTTPRRLLGDAVRTSRRTGAPVDLMILGEGIDSIRALENVPGFSGVVGNAYVMGGGRLDNSGAISFTRNWIAHRDEVLTGLERIGAGGDSVFVFSTNEFGGALVARTDAPLGNSAVAFSALTDASGRSTAVRAVTEHWTNWTRLFGWAMQKPETRPATFDPNSDVRTLMISPLGLHIADSWNSSAGETGRPNWVMDEFAPVDTARTGRVAARDGSRVRWIRQTGGQSIEPIAVRFRESLRTLIDSREARELDAAVREESIFGPRAADARARVELAAGGHNGGAGSFCPSLPATVGRLRE